MLPVIMAGTALAGGLGQWLSDDAAAKNYRKAMAEYTGNMAGAMGGYQDASQQAIDKYNAMARQYLNTPEGVSRWLNPNMDYQLEQVAKQNAQQYATGGKMLSGAAMKGLQDRSQNVAKLSWQDAFNNMNASNNQGMGHAGNLANMNLGQAGNIFNAQQGMYANQLSGAMGQPTSGVGSWLTGMAGGLNAGSGAVNAMSNAKKSGLIN